MKAKIILAPIGVAIGVASFVSISCLLTNYFEVTDFYSQILANIGFPKFVLYLIGVITTVSFFPFFIAGIRALGQKGAVGDADKLRTWGAYKYVRNPMYAGLSFTILGVGMFLNHAGIILAGLLWLIITYFQCKREEKKLAKVYGEVYSEYMKHTPMFMPDFCKVIKDLLKGQI